MFVDFDKVFNNKPQTQIRVPEALVSYLSRQLPDGTKYIADDDGNCILVQNEKPIKIGGMILSPSEEQKKILGKKYTLQDILDYSYNSQKPIALTLKKEGHILLNGKEFPIDKLQYSPYAPVKYASGSALMIPSLLPKPFKIVLGCSKYERTVSVKRVPHESISTLAFESEKEVPLYIQYYLDEKKHSMTLSLSLNLIYARSIGDIVESASIYNAFLDGKGLVCGKRLESSVTDAKIKRFDEDSIEFWEKVLSLEQELGVRFVPPQEDVGFETIILIEQLYQNLIKGVPIRETNTIESVTYKENKGEEKSILDAIGHSILLEFDATMSFNLFGIRVKLPCITRIFHVKLGEPRISGKKRKIMLEDESDQKKRFASVLCFKNQEDLEYYRKLDRKSTTDQFYSAKYARDYLDTI